MQKWKVCAIEPEVKNNYEQEIIFYTFLAYNQVFFMESLDCWAIFRNLYRDDSSKTEYLVNATFSLQFFAFSPQQLILRTQRMVNKHLAFLVNVFLSWSVASECFLLTNVTITRLMVLVTFLPSCSLWQPSVSELFSSVPESLQILITASSGFWS